jgi:chorismate lyase / 3-hydroxybenzoate synthase
VPFQPISYTRMNATASTAVSLAACSVLFDGQTAAIESLDGRPVLRVALPLLAGANSELLLAGADEPAESGGCTLFQQGPLLAGFVVADPTWELEDAAGELYRRLFAAVGGLHLYRIWNYVPQIGAVTKGLENYHRFCRGRSLAFEEKFGKTFQRRLPAASAVGAVMGPLAIGFLAGRAEPHHFENPRQVPAFEYPPEYGPRPPSFSRATVVNLDHAQRTFISGTAAIRGHATVATQDLEGQLDCMLENLELIGAATGAGPKLGQATAGQRTFKVYVRRTPDLARVQAKLERELLRPGDAVSYLQADICRPDLLVEVEALLAS